MSLSAYWPSRKNVNACIRPEAETADQAVLLAVHQRVGFLARAAGSVTEEARTEEQLLEALLTEDTGGSAVLVPITGPSGVGKSHVIRWLYAQLERHPRREDFVVVLVPKTASLRNVVELILQPLRGADYERLRTELTTAIGSVRRDEAVSRLATELALQLNRRAEEWGRRLVPGNGATQADRDRVYHAKRLPAVLGDPIVSDRMLARALDRIVGRALGGAIPEGAEADSQFIPADFELPHDLDLSDASKPARDYLAWLGNREDHSKAAAVNVLNDVIDGALRNVFQFAKALGNKTIEEIVGEVRVQLLADNKELIVLIEDFAALAGIQETLLSLAIAEAESGGVRKRAQLRTALAVTDGFLPQRDTILTRAKYEWVIPSRLEDREAVLQRMVDLTGRYLNAGRWGAETLKNQFRTRSNKHDLYGWVRAFSDDSLDAQASDQLNAFGRSSSGIPLFPFNEAAVRSFAEHVLTQGGALVFNPRTFLNQVLRLTLLLRDEFNAKQFPPADYKQAVLKPRAAAELPLKRYSTEVERRVASMLAHWCGNPDSINGTSPVAKSVFEAFGLPFPFAQTEGGAAPIFTPIVTPTPPHQPPPPHPEQLDPFATELDNWAGGMALGQKAASRIRTVLATAMKDRVDWNLLRIRPVEIKSSWIWLPNARVGNPSAGVQIRVPDVTIPALGWIRQAILALDKWEREGRRWAYVRAEDDYPIAQQLLDLIFPQVERALVDEAQSRLSVLLRALYSQSLLLGTPGRDDSSASRLMKALAQPAPDTSVSEDDSQEAEIAPLLAVIRSARDSRSALIKHALEWTACYQGARGQEVKAFDYERAMKWRLGAQDDGSRLRDLPDGLRESVAQVTTQLPAVVSRYRAAVRDRGETLSIEFGASFEKGPWAAALRSTLQSASQMGLLPANVRIAELHEEVSRLERSALTDLMDSVAKVIEYESASNRELEDELRLLGRVDLRLLVRTAAGLKKLSEVLSLVVQQVTSEERTLGDFDLDRAIDDLMSQLEAADRELERLN